MADPCVLIVGGGVAGAVVAGDLVQSGVAVTVLSTPGGGGRSVAVDGEARAQLERSLGLGAWIRADGVASAGSRFTWGRSGSPWVWPGERVHVDAGALRSRMHLRLEEMGARVLDGAVTGVLGDRGRILGVQTESGELDATVVVDASGTECAVGRHLGGTRAAADRRLEAVWASGPGELGERRVVSLEQGWGVATPDGPGRVCVGFVSDAAERAADVDLASLADVLGVQAPETECARGSHPALAQRQTAGDGWFLVGEAGWFVDPVFGLSVGVAARTAARAAKAIAQGLAGGPPVLAGAAERFSDGGRRRYRSWLRLARYWYRSNAAGPFWDRQRSYDANPGDPAVRALIYMQTGRYLPDAMQAVLKPADEQVVFRGIGASERDVLDARRVPETPSARWRRDDEEGGTRVNVPARSSGRRLELFIASGCNLHCAFCCESDRIQRKAFMPWDQLETKLVAAAEAGIDVIQFMGGEATLHPQFPGALRRAKQLGMGTYVITNLMRWQRRDFAEAVGPWLDEVMVSMHAGDAETGHEVTGVRNWWRGFQVASANAQATLQGRVRCSTVLTRHNVDHLEAIADNLLAFRPHAWVMGCAVPVDGTRTPAEVMNLTLTELKAMRPRFRALSRRCADAGCKLVFFSMPHCVLGPDLWDDSHDLWLGDQDLTDDAPSASDTVTFWSQADDLPRSRPVTLARRRVERCKGCAREDRCGGHFAAYLDLHGDAELEPIRG